MVNLSGYNVGAVFATKVAANGAVYEQVVMKKKDGTKGLKTRFIQGASKEALDEIRRSPRKEITKAQAQRAFDKYYSNPANFKSRRGMKQAKTYDLRHTTKDSRISKTKAYLRNPHKYDFEGVDTGPVPVKYPAGQRLDALKAQLERGRATVAANRERRRNQSAGWW